MREKARTAEGVRKTEDQRWGKRDHLPGVDEGRPRGEFRSNLQGSGQEAGSTTVRIQVPAEGDEDHLEDIPSSLHTSRC